MKIKIIMPILLIVLMLSGCQMPFSKDKSVENIAFLDANARLMEASNEIDKTMIDELTKGASAKTDVKQLSSNVTYSLKLQQNLYESIRKEEPLPEISQVKYIYLSVINQRTMSCQMLINTLNENNYDLLTQTIAKVKIEDAKQLEKSLIDLNATLKSAGLKEKKTLYELTKK
jgi:hypothetical protein